MLTFTGDVQLENLILKESALVSVFLCNLLLWRGRGLFPCETYMYM